MSLQWNERGGDCPVLAAPSDRVGRDYVAASPAGACIDANPYRRAALDLDRAFRPLCRLHRSAHGDRQQLQFAVRHCALRLPTPTMQQVRVHIVALRHPSHRHPRRKALLDDPHLLCRRPTSTTLWTRQNRNCPHVYPLTRQLTGLISTRATSRQGGLHRTRTLHCRGGPVQGRGRNPHGHHGTALRTPRLA